MIGEILATLNIAERLARLWHWFQGTRTSPAQSVAARFVRLFESHKVHRNQIPRFFGHGLTVKDVHDEASLLIKLDETLLEGACILFAVRREWLDGAETQVYPCHDFYKRPDDIAGFLSRLKANNPDGDLGGVLLAPENDDGQALIILHEIIGTVGDKPIYRYHLCNNWRFEYWKSRAYLTAFIAVAWKHKVHVHGLFMPAKEIDAISGGEMLLASDGTWANGGKKWYPEDMALRPDTFLRGVDLEQDTYGLIASLELWLRLEQQDYMNTGLSMYEAGAVRQLFEQEATKCQSAFDKSKH